MVKAYVLIQGIQQAVAKPPQEKQNGDQTDGIDGLFQREFGGIGPLVVLGPQRPSLDPFLPAHDGDVACGGPRTAKGSWSWMTVN